MATILVVEDDPPLRKLLRLALEAAGHNPLLVADPRSALDATQSHRVDAVVTDFRLPGMSGLALLARLRHLEPTLPALLVTGDDLLLRGHREALVPGVRVLLKPFSARELLAELDDMLGRVDVVGRPLWRHSQRLPHSPRSHNDP